MIKNKKIVITGASSGIGFEVLKRIAAEQSNTILAVARRAESLEGYAPNVIPFSCDTSNAEGVDKLFAKAEEVFEKIDILYANAGFSYYEKVDYVDWNRVKNIFDLNTLSPIYSYAKYLEHLNGRDGHIVYTVSAIGELSMPGFALYSASKFGLNGFQQSIRNEMPSNLKMTSVFPVSTKTNFAKVAGNGAEISLPPPVQDVNEVADAIVAGIEAEKEKVYPYKAYPFFKVLMAVIPAIRNKMWKDEVVKLNKYVASKK